MSKTSYRFCNDCNQLHEASAWPHAPEAAEPKYDPGANYDEYLNGPRAGTFRRCNLCGDLHDIYNWPANHIEEQLDLRHEYAGIGFISDNLESIGGLNGLQCQASGKWFTSKAKMRQEYKARNVVEVGNDSQRFSHGPKSKPKPDRKAIKEAVAKAHNVVFNEGGTVENYMRRRKVKDTGAFGRVNPSK